MLAQAGEAALGRRRPRRGGAPARRDPDDGAREPRRGARARLVHDAAGAARAPASPTRSTRVGPTARRADGRGRGRRRRGPGARAALHERGRRAARGAGGAGQRAPATPGPAASTVVLRYDEDGATVTRRRRRRRASTPTRRGRATGSTGSPHGSSRSAGSPTSSSAPGARHERRGCGCRDPRAARRRPPGGALRARRAARRRAGHRGRRRGGRRRGRRRARRWRPRPDVVLMDLRMPVLDGADATARDHRRRRAARCWCSRRTTPTPTSCARSRPAPPATCSRTPRASSSSAAVRAAARGETVLAPPLAAKLMRQVRGGDQLTAARDRGARARGPGPVATARSRRELFIGEATVKTHLLHVFDKLGVSDRTRRGHGRDAARRAPGTRLLSGLRPRRGRTRAASALRRRS